MKKICLSLCLMLFALLSFSQRNDVQSNVHKIGKVIGAIDKLYVDTVDINKITEKAIVALLKELDPHSTYISKENYLLASEQITGSFEGVGVEFMMQEDTLVVVMPVSGGPAEKVGVQAGDQIIAIDGENIAGVKISQDKIFKALRGKKGTKVKIDVIRKNVKEILHFTIVRNKIPINSVDASYEMRPGVAYIKLGRFTQNSMAEILVASEKFKNQPEFLILDLRGNGGGIMGAAIELSDQFFDANKILVFTSGLNSPSHKEFSTSAGIFKDTKLIVLINENSASASEIVAGAIQDWDRGILIGRRTYGKGLIQRQMPIGDGSYLRLTVSRYHTPTGRVIQRPYKNGNPVEYAKDHLSRYTSGEAFAQEKIEMPDSLKYLTLISERPVFGGGGITPDIFVPQDTTYFSESYAKLVRQGIINNFVLSFVSNNRDSLKASYHNFDEFNKNFNIDDKLIEELVAFAQKRDVVCTPEDIETSKYQLRVIMKALAARDLWGSPYYFRIINTNLDNEFTKAIEVIDNWEITKKEILQTK